MPGKGGAVFSTTMRCSQASPMSKVYVISVKPSARSDASVTLAASMIRSFHSESSGMSRLYLLRRGLELPQVIVEPTHRGLDHIVHRLEVHRSGYSDTSPDQRLDVFKFDAQDGN